jgi:hypothetical protein
MDPISLITPVVSLLMPYAAKGAEKFAEEVGQAAFEKVKGLLATLRTRWRGDQEAIDTLVRFEEKPDRYHPILEDVLKEKLGQDQELAKVLTEFLEGMGPTLQIIQKMKDAEQITGLEAKEMTRGEAAIIQEIDKAKNVTGAKIDRIG